MRRRLTTALLLTTLGLAITPAGYADSGHGCVPRVAVVFDSCASLDATQIVDQRDNNHAPKGSS